jgi:hypothetical protein
MDCSVDPVSVISPTRRLAQHNCVAAESPCFGENDLSGVADDGLEERAGRGGRREALPPATGCRELRDIAVAGYGIRRPSHVQEHELSVGLRNQ